MPETLAYDPLVVSSIGFQEEPLTPLQEEILQLKAERNAIILAHNYQIDPIQRIADYVGDSLGLSYQAAKTDADVILFCGVHFMAETAKIINPDKTVVLPELKAGCSLADSCPAPRLQAYKDAHPDTYVVAYINCSAAVKAISDVICTSGNAVRIVRRVPEDKDILFVPDQNLGQWVAKRTGRRLKLWPGSCYAHVLFTVQSLERLRDQFPGAPIVAHPECVETVRDMADEVCSTEGILGFCLNHPSRDIIVVTETGMLNRLRREIPGKRFIAGPTDTCACNDCRFMKMNTVENMRDALANLSPVIELDESIRRNAFQPIKRMLDWSN